MTRNQRERYLKRNGFALWKQGSKHCIYSDGLSKLTVPTGSKVAAHNVRNMMADVKRMVANREGILRMREPERRLHPGTIAEITRANASAPPIQAERFEVDEAKSPRRKYDAVSRRKLERAIEELYKSGIHEAKKMLLPLVEQGYKDPDGGTLKQSRVNHYLGLLLASGNIKQAPETSLPQSNRQVRSGRLPDTVMGILTDPGLSDGQKVRMISAYAEL